MKILLKENLKIGLLFLGVIIVGSTLINNDAKAKAFFNEPRACTATIYGKNSCGERVSMTYTVVDLDGNIPYAALCAEAGVEAENMLVIDCLTFV
jgi:hypothetical protein